MTEQEAIKYLTGYLDSVVYKEKCVEAHKLAIKALEEVQQYRVIGTVEEIKANMEELKRWHTDKTNPKIKNVFADTSTLICHNCDHKDDYIENLEAEIDEYRTIGTVEECQASVEIIRYMIQEGIEPEVLKAYVWFEDELVKNGSTVKSVLEAREKQKPKKPKEYEDKYYGCPTCGNVILHKWEKYPTKLMDKKNGLPYCLNCGQKLDWSDGE